MDDRITPDSLSQETPANPVISPVSPIVTAPVAPIIPEVPVAPVVAPVQPAPAQTAVPTTPAFVPPAQPAAATVTISNEVGFKEDPDHRAHIMRDILHAQPKVWISVPLNPGEKPGTMLPVGINGYFVYIRKGSMVQVPQQVAQIVQESLNLDYMTGAEHELSRNEDKQRALA